MDYCEINRQLEYLIIIVETVTSPQWLAIVGQSPKCPFTLQNSQFPVLSPGNGILLSLPPVIINVCCPGEGGGLGLPPPTSGWCPLPTHGLHCRPSLLVLLAGKYLGWERRDRQERRSLIRHSCVQCPLPLALCRGLSIEGMPTLKLFSIKLVVSQLFFSFLVNKTSIIIDTINDTIMDLRLHSKDPCNQFPSWIQ